MKQLLYKFNLLHCAMCTVLSACLLCGCTADNVEEKSYTPLRVNGFMADEAGGLGTRAIPTGYTAFAEPYDASTAADHQIGVYVTRDDASPVYGVFNYTATNEWTSQVNVKTGVDHYIYGFMPTNAVASSTINNQSSIINHQSSNYSSGATLTLTGIPAVTAQDICVITGVGKGAVQSTVQSIDEVALTPGNFLYQASYTDNYMYLLFDHIYSRVNFNFAVDADYDVLRTIKICKVEVGTTTGSDKFDAVVTLTPADPESPANPESPDNPASPVFSGNGTSGATATIFSGDSALSTTPTIIPVYVCPEGQKSFTLTITYDVYDKAGNLLTISHRTASNSFTLKDSSSQPLSSLEPGKSYEVNLTVAPSFLYQLSDADLNNPTFK